MFRILAGRVSLYPQGKSLVPVGRALPAEGRANNVRRQLGGAGASRNDCMAALASVELGHGTLVREVRGEQGNR